MRALTILRFGLRRARRHPGLIVLVYLASALPAWLLATGTADAYGRLFDRSLEAAEALEGGVIEVLVEAAAAPGVEEPSIFGRLPLRLGLALVLQILLAAGTVEVLLERSGRGAAPFAHGVGRHGWRFVRSAVWFLLAVGIAAVLFAFAARLAIRGLPEGADGRIVLAIFAVAGLLGGALFALLDLAYDLSRVAAASHGEGRTLLGFLRAAGHVLAHPWLFGTLYLAFLLPLAAVAAGYLALAAGWTPTGVVGVVLLTLVQQAAMLLRAGLQVCYWGAEIAYYQGLGEPRWCG